MIDNDFWAELPWYIKLGLFAAFWVGLHIVARLRDPSHRFFDW